MPDSVSLQPTQIGTAMMYVCKQFCCLLIRSRVGLNRFGGGDILIAEEEGTIGSILNVSSITFGASLLIDYGLSKMIKNFLDRIK